MRSILWFMMFVLMVPIMASPCSMRGYSAPIEVTSDFKLKITHREKPAVGIAVVLSKVVEDESEPEVRKHVPIGNFVTDGDGSVRFDGLARGEYWIKAEHLGIEAANEWIKVDPAAKKRKDVLSFEWGDYGTPVPRVAGVLTTSMSGNTGNKLMDIVRPQHVRVPGAQLTLKAAFSNEQYRTVSDSNGEFFIDPVPPGTYLLTISGGKYFSEDIEESTQILYVSATADPRSLDFEAKPSGCWGIRYDLTPQRTSD